MQHLVQEVGRWVVFYSAIACGLSGLCVEGDVCLCGWLSCTLTRVRFLATCKCRHMSHIFQQVPEPTSDNAINSSNHDAEADPRYILFHWHQ